jgi:hypothetical protein
MTFQWRLNGVPFADDSRVNGSKTASLTVRGIDASLLGNYEVVLRNEAGTDLVSGEVRFDGNPIQRGADLLPLTAVEGTSVRWSGFAVSETDVSYEWKDAGSKVVSTSSIESALSLVNVSSAQAGTYTLTVKNKVS